MQCFRTQFSPRLLPCGWSFWRQTLVWDIFPIHSKNIDALSCSDILPLYMTYRRQISYCDVIWAKRRVEMSFTLLRSNWCVCEITPPTFSHNNVLCPVNSFVCYESVIIEVIGKCQKPWRKTLDPFKRINLQCCSYSVLSSRPDVFNRFCRKIFPIIKCFHTKRKSFALIIWFLRKCLLWYLYRSKMYINGFSFH